MQVRQSLAKSSYIQVASFSFNVYIFEIITLTFIEHLLGNECFRDVFSCNPHEDNCVLFYRGVSKKLIDFLKVSSKI